MDPLTHALLGATAAQAAFGPRLGRHAWLLGAVGGVLPDADVLIGSASDPLLAIEYHRQFTHAFAFVPLGGLAAAAPWLLRRAHRAHWRPVLAAATIGYATHGLLDACTNYGTHLLWPFSELRTAWHWVTTVGPLLTLLLLVGLFFAVRGKSRLPAVLALAGALAYVGGAAWQQQRALDVQAQIAAARGHPVARGEMFPTVGNPLIWRSVYASGGVLHTDRIRMLRGDGVLWKPGYTVALQPEATLPPAALADPRVVRDYRRFSYFSAGWVARAPDDPSVIGDARYSLSLESFVPIWGVRFHPGAAPPTEWVDFTARNRIPARELWREIQGEAPGYRPLPGG
ncbi:MAG: metal-dependent hydrolase [Rhodocyclales bacterium]|nr:metal-dependent hydrolase [Rhodocyclales bacterium]